VQSAAQGAPPARAWLPPSARARIHLEGSIEQCSSAGIWAVQRRPSDTQARCKAWCERSGSRGGGARGGRLRCAQEVDAVAREGPVGPAELARMPYLEACLKVRAAPGRGSVFLSALPPAWHRCLCHAILPAVAAATQLATCFGQSCCLS